MPPPKHGRTVSRHSLDTVLPSASKRIPNSPRAIPIVNSRAELFFKGIELLTKIGLLLSFRTWAVPLRGSKLRDGPTATVVGPSIRPKLLMLPKHASKPSYRGLHAGLLCLRKLGPRDGTKSARDRWSGSWELCAVTRTAVPCGKSIAILI